MTNEEIISDFMQKHYTDERLAMLLAHAEDGKLSFNSCCCLIGIPTVNHALIGRGMCPEDAGHIRLARGECESVGDRTETAFCELGFTDEQRRERIIPLIRAEIERREQLRSESSIPLDSQVVSV